MYARLVFLFFAAAVACSAGRAQVSGGVGLAYHELEGIDRWGLSGGLYFPMADHLFDIVPNFEYYNSRWSAGGSDTASDTSDVVAVSIDLHANLPALADRVRAFVGAGALLTAVGGNSALGVNLHSGVYVRPRGWKIFPYGQVTYRVLPDFDSGADLDTYFVRGGFRIVL